jgi:hypothetical protein
MRIKHLAIAVGAALVLAACGQGLTGSPNVDPDATTTVPSAPTTTVPVTTTVPDLVDTTTTVPSAPTTTVPVTTTVPPSASDPVEVTVYIFGGPDADPDTFECSAVTPVTRLVEPPLLLTGAMEALLGRPTPEEQAAGYGSWFSTETGWTVESVIVSDGVARIDFGEDSPLINNASTSCGSVSFLAQLDSTATQFPTVDRAVYSFGGDVDAFYEWLQRSSPEF